ncbi:MAG: hypothetical protein ABIQ95_15455 [Bdellovibrionia bacterium]
MIIKSRFKIALALFFLILQSKAAFAGTWLDNVLVSLHSMPLGPVAPDSRTVLAEFQGHIFPMKVAGDEFYAAFEIQGQDQVCFDFRVKALPEGKKGYVSWINTEVPGCPLPSNHKGTFLLNLVDAMGKEGGLFMVQLEDESKVRCKLNGVTTDLALLRIIQKGQSWYGSHGYFVQKNRSEYDESVAKLNSFTLNQFQREFPELRNEILKYASSHSRNLEARWTGETFREHYIELKEWISNFELIYGQNKSLNEFLSWIWEEDCSAFNPITSLIFPVAEWTFMNSFDWISSIRTIRTNGSYLIKQFH